MSTLLYIESSPREADSYSSQAAAIYLDALPRGVTVEHLNLFAAGLPEFDAVAAAAKYKVMRGEALNPDEEGAWSEVVALVEGFKAADHYLIAAPMWNFQHSVQAQAVHRPHHPSRLDLHPSPRRHGGAGRGRRGGHLLAGRQLRPEGRPAGPLRSSIPLFAIVAGPGRGWPGGGGRRAGHHAPAHRRRRPLGRRAHSP